MKPTIEQIDEAIDDYICGRSNEVIPYAIHVLKKLMEEPTEGMIDVGNKTGDWGSPISSMSVYDSGNPDDIFKAMRDQLLEEIE